MIVSQMIALVKEKAEWLEFRKSGCLSGLLGETRPIAQLF